MKRKGFIENFRDILNSGTGEQLRGVCSSSRQFQRIVADLERDLDRAMKDHKCRGQILRTTERQDADLLVSGRPPKSYSADLSLRDEAELALITLVKRLGFVAVIVACFALLIALL